MNFLRRVILVTVCALCLGSGAQAGDAVTPGDTTAATNAARAGVRVGMAKIPAGKYEPAFRMPNEPKEVIVDEFLLDILPVTNREFLEFVRANPQWQRSRVKRLFADEQYLAHWAGDLELGRGVAPAAPVVRVSWFAARAYARWQGKRLPTTAEWEYAAQASESQVNGLLDRSFRARLHALYTSPASAELLPVGAAQPNFHGLHDLHGLVWEWVADFSTAMVTGDARGDTGLERQLFCGSGAQGAKDIGDFPAFMRFAFRSSLKASYTVPNLGFRCAASANNPERL
jgi:formylglycine-generating enzyme required for sulfatase activity